MNANEHIETLVDLAKACDAEGIKRALKRIVPEYQPWAGQDEIGEKKSTGIFNLTEIEHVTGEKIYTDEKGLSAGPMRAVAGGRQTKWKLD